MAGYARWVAAGLLLMALGQVAVGNRINPCEACTFGRPGPVALAEAADQGPQPLPTPQVPGAVQQLEQQAKRGLEQLSAQAKSKISEETARLQADAKQRAAREAGNVVKGFTARLQETLLNLVAQVCGASPAALLLGGAGLLLAIRALRRP